MADTSLNWPQILTGLGALGGLSALVGLWLNRKRVPAEVRLITAQAEVQAATREHLAADLATKTLQSAEARIKELVEEKRELRAERDEYKRHAGEAEQAQAEAERARRVAEAQRDASEKQLEALHRWMKSKGIEYPS